MRPVTPRNFPVATPPTSYKIYFSLRGKRRLFKNSAATCTGSPSGCHTTSGSNKNTDDRRVTFESSDASKHSRCLSRASAMPSSHALVWAQLTADTEKQSLRPAYIVEVHDRPGRGRIFSRLQPSGGTNPIMARLFDIRCQTSGSIAFVVRGGEVESFQSRSH